MSTIYQVTDIEDKVFQGHSIHFEIDHKELGAGRYKGYVEFGGMELVDNYAEKFEFDHYPSFKEVEDIIVKCLEEKGEEFYWECLNWVHIYDMEELEQGNNPINCRRITEKGDKELYDKLSYDGYFEVKLGEITEITIEEMNEGCIVPKRTKLKKSGDTIKKLKEQYMITDVDLSSGSEVTYEYVFEDLSKEKDDQEFEIYTTMDAQEIVMRNQDKFIFDEKPSVDTVANIFYEEAESYTDDGYFSMSHFHFKNEEDLFYTGQCSVYICPEVVDYEFEIIYEEVKEIG